MGFNLIIHSTYDTGLTDTGLAVQTNRLVLGAEWYWSLVKQLYVHWCWCNSIIVHEKQRLVSGFQTWVLGFYISGWKDFDPFRMPEHCFETRICCKSKTLSHIITSLVPFLDRHILLFLAWSDDITEISVKTGASNILLAETDPHFCCDLTDLAISQDKDIRYVLWFCQGVPNKMPVVVYRVPGLL